jgi:hypothetical protein
MMTLAGRILREKRTLLLPLAIALVANVAAYFLAVRPLAASSAGAADRARAAAQSLRTAEQRHAQAKALVEGKARADEELSLFYKKVLPADFTAARRMTYTSLPALARETSVSFQQRSNTPEYDDKTGLGRLSIKMELQGEYENVRDFIYRLESAPEFVIIDEVTLTQSDADRALALVIQLSTYFRARPDGL